MGAVNTTYTFTATDTITSTKMNNIIDQTTMTPAAIIGTTLEVVMPAGQMKIRSAGITSNEMGSNSVTTSSITNASVIPTKLSAGGPNWTTSTTSLGNAVTGSYTASVAPARTGDGTTAIQLGAQTGVSSSASMTRNSGVNGTLEITNTGTGAITLSASNGVTFGTANMPNPSGTAPVFGCRAWVNFDGTTAANVSGSYTRTGTVVTCAINAHGLIVGNVVRLDFTGGTPTSALDGTYTVTEIVDLNTFKVTTVASGDSTGGTVIALRRAIRRSGNVSSVTYLNSPGQYAVNFAIPMQDANYAISGFANYTSGAVAGLVGANSTSASTAASCDISVGASPTGSEINTSRVNVMFIG